MSLAGSIASITFASSMWAGSGSWTRMPSTASSAFSPASSCEQLVLGGVGREPDVVGMDPDALRGLVLARDVDVRGGVVADEHGREPDVAELRDLGGDFLAHLRRERLAVDHVRGHRRQRYDDNGVVAERFPRKNDAGLDRRTARGARARRRRSTSRRTRRSPSR